MASLAFRERLRRDLLERPPGNFAALDGMRGFASVIITVYHVALFTGRIETRLPGGTPGIEGRLVNGLWSGIDIFFVLSGFLIGRILVADLAATGRLRYRAFLLRRAFRIFPAYYLVLLTALAAISLVRPGGVFPLLFVSSSPSQIRAKVWSNFLYVSNYVVPGHRPNLFSWGWSLCVEEHFYLILPPLLWILYRLPARARLPLLSLGVLLPFAGRALQYLRDPGLDLVGSGFYYYSHNRFDEIFVGVLIAYLHVNHGPWLRRAVQGLGQATWIAGVLLIAAVWAWGGLFARGAFAVVFQFLVMALGSGLLLCNGLYLDNAVRRFFEHRAWYPLARVSYGSYLVHPFILFGVLQAYAWTVGISSLPAMGTAGYLALCGVVLGLSTMGAALLFVLLERPLMDVGAGLARRSQAAQG